MSEHTNLRRERSGHLEQHMQRPWGGAAHLSQGEARAGWLEQKGCGQGLGGEGDGKLAFNDGMASRWGMMKKSGDEYC